MWVRKRLPFGKRLIEETNSAINGKISVYRFWGRPILEVGGLEQSGDFIASIWKKALKKIHHSIRQPADVIHNSLILGLGAGSAARLVSRFWPEAKIIGVEIDPEIIRLGRCHFRLNEIKNLRVVCADAAKEIKNFKFKIKNFNLILIDLYLGDRVPVSCETKKFLLGVKQLLAPGGTAIFNRLYYQGKREETDEFIKKLAGIFSHLDRVRTPSNLLLLAS